MRLILFFLGMKKEGVRIPENMNALSRILDSDRGRGAGVA